jgi:hypothetical protein
MCVTVWRTVWIGLAYHNCHCYGVAFFITVQPVYFENVSVYLSNWIQIPYIKSIFKYDFVSHLDAQITGGPTQNSGLIEASIDGNTYSLCYDGVDMNAANVVCNHLGYK